MHLPEATGRGPGLRLPICTMGAFTLRAPPPAHPFLSQPAQEPLSLSWNRMGHTHLSSVTSMHLFPV